MPVIPKDKATTGGTGGGRAMISFFGYEDGSIDSISISSSGSDIATLSTTC